MRQAGTLKSKQEAERFADFLLTLGIESKIDGAGDAWSVWIRDENQVAKSKEELAQFVANPGDPRYEAVAKQAQAARREAADRAKRAQKNMVDLRQRWSAPGMRPRVTILMVAASVAVAVLTEMGQKHDSIMLDLLISTHRTSLAEIQHGQLWRLVTPIFLHFSTLHLVFNMMWLYDLGRIIETRLGWWRYSAMVLAMAIPSNLAQFVAGGPLFGGMSGVVYGLFGYAWIRGRLDPTSGFYINPNTVFLMIGWFVLCLLDVFPDVHVANTAHAVGLGVGCALGALPYVVRILRQNT